MAVQWHRSNSYESALTDDSICGLATEKLCPSVTQVCRVSKPKSNSVPISPELDVWKACTRELDLEFVDLTYKVKIARNGMLSFFRRLIATLNTSFRNHVYNNINAMDNVQYCNKHFSALVLSRVVIHFLMHLFNSVNNTRMCF